MVLENTSETQDNALVHSTYTVDALVRTVELLIMHDQRDQLSVSQRAAVEIWQSKVYWTLPEPLRDVAEATVKALHEQRFMGVL